MAAPSGTGDPVVEFAQTGLGEILSREPYRFEFFQAVRLLSRAFPDREPVGRLANPQQEVLRFRAHASMAFPASEIQGLALASGAPHSMIVNFMGLTGPMGALPLYYTELVIQRIRVRDTAMRDFLDTFNHRIVSLFYQAWEKYRFTIAYERGEQDRFSHCLLDLIGLGTPGLQRRQAVLDDALIYYAGLLALHARSAQALTQILMDYFEVPAEVVQLTGGWYSLDRPSQCCFENANAYSEQLGVGAVVGDEIWDPQSAAKIVLGPLPAASVPGFSAQRDGVPAAPGALEVLFQRAGRFRDSTGARTRRSAPLRVGRGGRSGPAIGLDHLGEIGPHETGPWRYDLTDVNLE